MSNKGKTIDVETQKQIVFEYREGVRGCGAKALSKNFHVSVSSVQRIVKIKNVVDPFHELLEGTNE